MNLFEKIFGTVKTENEVSLSADASLFVLIFMILVLILVGIFAVKKL